MLSAASPDRHREELVAQMSTKWGWNLSEEECLRYCADLAIYLPPDASSEQVQRTCRYYHEDHQIFFELIDATHPHTDQVWAPWLQYTLAVLASRGFTHRLDGSIDLDDLAQEAMIELVKSLPTFRFQSRLKTWAYRVIVNTAHDRLRPGKKPQNCISLDQLSTWDQPIPEYMFSEVLADQQHLIILVRTVLAEARDTRLMPIFFLRYLHNRPTKEIAQLVRLHESRVRSLLRQARNMLSEHPDIQHWHRAHHDALGSGIPSLCVPPRPLR